MTSPDPDLGRRGGGETGLGCGWGEQSVGWALHALEPDEELATEAHLSVCGACEELVAATHEVMARWAAAIPPLISSPQFGLGQHLRVLLVTTPQRHTGGSDLRAGNSLARSLASAVTALSGWSRWAGVRFGWITGGGAGAAAGGYWIAETPWARSICA